MTGRRRLVMSAEKAEVGLPVIARIRSYASAGLDPKIMDVDRFMRPVKLLKR